MRLLLQILRDLRLREEREQVAYWKAKSDALKQMCSREHTLGERMALVEATAQHARHEAILDYIMETSETVKKV